MRGLYSAIYLGFALLVATGCYFKPVPDDFDRYIYEAILRSRTQSTWDIYRIVKHESPRAEASSILDSPDHMAQLEPLYAIRPLYIEAAELFYRAGLAPQQALNMVSAASIFLLALVLCAATRAYLFPAVFLCFPAVLLAGRVGTPDAFSAVFTVAGIAALMKEKLTPGIVFLMISVWARTDNLLIVLPILAWLALRKRITAPHAILLSLLAMASVYWINTLSGNYGWKVLLHFSFVGGKYPAEIAHGITFSQYAHAFVSNLASLIPQLAPWLLFGIVAWRYAAKDRPYLVIIALTCAAHFCLFPSGESRYFTWAYLIIGVIFIRALQAKRALVLASGEQQAQYAA